jgi:hypothetical protein
MLHPIRIQTEVFSHIRATLPAHVALVDIVADTLELSIDSTYRRIRGEKPLSIEELVKLAVRFKFSVDRLLSLETESYIFSGKLASAHDHVFEKWLQNSLEQFTFMAAYPNAHVYYMAKDLPLAHFFQTPELASFKFFFWQKSILQYNELKGAKFKMDKSDETSKALADKIVVAYNKIHSSEVWAVETINSSLRQIEYYYDAGIFESKADPLHLCDSLDRLVAHLESQAEEGIKFSIGKSPVAGNGQYFIYNNELIVGNNNVLADLGDVKITYLNHTSINYVSTRDTVFNEYQLRATLNMINKSEPLHTVNEKGRNAFFNRLRNVIDTTRQRIR